VTEATTERIEPDPLLAGDFLRGARRAASDSAKPGLHAESRQLLLHEAAKAACDAVLAVNGWQVVGSDGGHRLRLKQARDLLGGFDEELFERLDDLRQSRNQVSYSALSAKHSEVDAASAAVSALVDLAAAAVEPHLPDWQSGQ
jgi:hypothetical protein